MAGSRGNISSDWEPIARTASDWEPINTKPAASSDWEPASKPPQQEGFLQRAGRTLKDIATTTGKEIAGFAEGAANTLSNFTTGAAGQAVSGLSALNTLVGLNPSEPALNLDAASRVAKESMERLHPITTYTPQTAAGEKHAGILARPFEDWIKGSQYVGNTLVESGHPTLGAILGTGLEVAPIAAPIAGGMARSSLASLRSRMARGVEPIPEPVATPTPEPSPSRPYMGVDRRAKNRAEATARAEEVVAPIEEVLKEPEVVAPPNIDNIPKQPKTYEEVVAATEGADLLRGERKQVEHSRKVGEWRSQYSEPSEIIASGDIARSDYEKLSGFVENNKISVTRAHQMIDDAVISGVVDPKVGEYMKSKVASPEPPRSATEPDFTAILNNLDAQRATLNGKTNKGFFTDSDFQNALKEGYPNVRRLYESLKDKNGKSALTPDSIKAALRNAESGKKLGANQQLIVDAFRQDHLDYLHRSIKDVDTLDLTVGDTVVKPREVDGTMDTFKVIKADGEKVVLKDGVTEEHPADFGETIKAAEVVKGEQSQGKPLYDGEQGKMFATPPTFGKKPQGRGVVEENPMFTEMKERQAEKAQTSFPQEDGNISAGSLAYGMELPKYANNINLERVGADYSAKKLILDTADRYKGAIDEARRGTITLEETKKLADDLGFTVDDLMKRRKGQAFNAEEVTAARDILNTSAQRLREVQVKAAELGTDEALATFRQALDQHAAIQAEVSGAAAEAGRALSAHRIISGESKNYRAMLDALGGRELNQQILERFAKVDTTNIKEVNAFIREFAKAKKTDMIYEAWINFLLSGPKTHIVNIASNALTFLTKPVETAVASGYESVASRVMGRKRERFIGEVPHDLLGGVVGIREGVRAAIKAWGEGLSSDTLIKVENAGKYQAIPGKTGEVIRIPGRALAAADEFFKSINYTSELYGMAYRKASIEGLRGKARLVRAAEYIQNPTADMMRAAKHEAEYRTFTQPYGEWSRVLERTRTIPGVKYIIPFMRTPINIAKFALERTPLNFARIAVKAAKGELKGAALADEMAKPILGSLIAVAAVEMVLEGNVTGGGPKDKPARDALFRTGWQPYSLKVGDKYISYARMEPLASVFGMAADFTELMDDSEVKNPGDYAESIALSISKNLTSKTFLKGLSAAFDAMSDPKRYGEQFVNNFAGSVIPSVVNTVATMADDTMRNTNGPLETMQNRIPFLSQALEPKRDLWGREIPKTGSAIERGFSPFPITEEKSDPVDKEIRRLGMSPGLPSKKIRGVELSPVQYDVYVRRAGERAYKAVSNIVSRPLDDDRKRDLIDKAIKGARSVERNKFANEFRIVKTK